jgi:hypothetical protein
VRLGKPADEILTVAKKTKRT